MSASASASRRSALDVAVRAAWRLGLLSGAVIAVPAGAVFALLDSVRVPGADPRVAVAIGAVYGASYIAHEAGHAGSARWVGRRAAADPSGARIELLGIGSWTSATVVRWSAGAWSDALIAAAGPAAGIGCAVPALALASTAPVALPLVLPFGAHAFALLPRQADGGHVFAVLNRDLDGPRRGCDANSITEGGSPC